MVMNNKSSDEPGPFCSLHGEPKLSKGYCPTCWRLLKRALRLGGDEAAHNLRMAIRVERWKAEGKKEFIKKDMLSVAKEGRKWMKE